MDIREELDVHPSRRVTIPGDSVAIILPIEIARDVKSMCILLRKTRRLNAEEKLAMQHIAGAVLLALLDTEEGEVRL